MRHLSSSLFHTLPRSVSRRQLVSETLSDLGLVSQVFHAQILQPVSCLTFRCHTHSLRLSVSPSLLLSSLSPLLSLPPLSPSSLSSSLQLFSLPRLSLTLQPGCLSPVSRLSRPLLSCSHLAHLSGFCAHPPVSCSPQVSHSPFLFSLHTEFLRSPPHPPAHGPVHTRLSWYSAVPLSPWRSFVLPGLSLRSRILLTPSHSHHLACSHGVSATRFRASFQRILSHGRSVLSLRRMWFTAVRFSQFSSVPFRQTAQPAGEPPAHYQSAVTRLPVSPPPSSGTDGSQPISFS